MDSSVPPSNKEEFVALIGQLVRENYTQNQRYTDGSYLAKILRKRFPSFLYSNIGLERLVDGVNLAEQQGVVVRNKTVRHLEIGPPETDTPSFACVRREVWGAFVFANRTYTSYLDRTNGFVTKQQALESAAGGDQAQRPSQLVRIDAISAETQKQWMRGFVASIPELAGQDAPIDDDRWWDAFSLWVKSQAPEIQRKWAVFRTENVVAQIRTWAETNQVPLRLLFSAPKPTIQKPVSHAVSESQDEGVRDAILAAIREMPLEQLEQLSLPVRYLLRHFKVR